MSLTLPQVFANTITTNCSGLQLSNYGLSATINGHFSAFQIPEVSLEIAEPEKRIMDKFSNKSLISMTHHFFRRHYFCGQGVEFNSADKNKRVVKIVRKYGDNLYENNTININPNTCNPIVLLHEIIHSIINEVETSYKDHNHVHSGLCGKLDVFTNEAPGFMLDIVNRLEMQYTPNQLGATSHGMMYLPIIHQIDDPYPSLNQYCTRLRPFSECADDESNPKKKIKIKPNKESKISAKKFMKLKFHDEYNTLKSIPGFKMEIDMKTYIDNNIKEFNSPKNINKCNNK